jgi:arsenical pump membrane protein
MSQAGLQAILTEVIAYLHRPGELVGTLLPGYFFATMAAFMNNMPSVMLGSIAIAHTSYSPSLIYANVIGNDIGPKFTPIGSLATLLWIYSVKRKSGIVINARYYMKIGLISALPVLTVTLAILLV